MNKYLRLLTFSIICLALCHNAAAGTIYSYRVDTSSPKFTVPNGLTQVLGNTAWTCNYEKGLQFTSFHCYAPSDDGDSDWGYEFGSTVNNMRQLVLWSDAFAGRVRKVKIVSAKDEGTAYNLTIKVGGNEYRKTSASKSPLFKYDRYEYVYEGDAQGRLEIIWANSSSSYRLNLIEIESDESVPNAALIINPPGGTITTKTGISISCSSPDAQIRYTTDSNMPTTTSPIYTSVLFLPLGNNRTVKAIAETNGHILTEPVIGYFNIVPHDGEYGSEGRPFNVDAARELTKQCESAEVWIKGYLVGIAANNIILSQEPFITEPAECVVVQRESAKTAIPIDTSNLKEMAYIHGTVSRDENFVNVANVDRFGLPFNSAIDNLNSDHDPNGNAVRYISITGQPIDEVKLRPGIYIRQHARSVTKVIVK